MHHSSTLPGAAGARRGAGRQLGAARGARWCRRSAPGWEPFRLVATEMDRGVNAVIEAEPAPEPSGCVPIKRSLYAAAALEGDGEVAVTK